MKEALYIALGWLFGLLSPRIVTWVQNHYERNDLRKAIFSDLENLAGRVTAIRYKIRMHLGTGDSDSMAWTRAMYQRFSNDCPQDVLEALGKLSELPEKELEATSASASAEENICLGLKPQCLPFIESTLAQLSLFSVEFQTHILEIRAQLNILNQEIEDAMFFYRLTFDPPCMDSNSAIIRKNLKAGYGRTEHRCKIIADRICSMLDTSEGEE